MEDSTLVKESFWLIGILECMYEWMKSVCMNEWKVYEWKVPEELKWEMLKVY